MVKNLKQYDHNYCIREKLLRKISPSKEKAEDMLKTAKEFVERINELLNNLKK